MNTKRIIASLCICFAMAAGLSAQKIKEGNTAPDFELTLSNGTKTALSALKGKAVLVHFWATWCPPCRRELPGMDALAKKLTAQGTSAKLVFIAVCVSDTEKSRADFMKKNGYTFPGGLDASGAVANLYEVEGVPTSILVAPDGKILKVNVGMMTESQLAAFVKGYAD